jgi:hypothetical protein
MNLPRDLWWLIGSYLSYGDVTRLTTTCYVLHKFFKNNSFFRYFFATQHPRCVIEATEYVAAAQIPWDELVRRCKFRVEAWTVDDSLDYSRKEIDTPALAFSGDMYYDIYRRAVIDGRPLSSICVDAQILYRTPSHPGEILIYLDCTNTVQYCWVAYYQTVNNDGAEPFTALSFSRSTLFQDVQLGAYVRMGVNSYLYLMLTTKQELYIGRQTLTLDTFVTTQHTLVCLDLPAPITSMALDMDHAAPVAYIVTSSGWLYCYHLDAPDCVSFLFKEPGVDMVMNYGNRVIVRCLNSKLFVMTLHEREFIACRKKRVIDGRCYLDYRGQALFTLTNFLHYRRYKDAYSGRLLY